MQHVATANVVTLLVLQICHAIVLPMYMGT